MGHAVYIVVCEDAWSGQHKTVGAWGSARHVSSTDLSLYDIYV